LLLNPSLVVEAWECGNPEGISKECGKGGKPALWLSMLSILCHFHGLLFEADQVEVAANTVCGNNDAMFGFTHAGIVSE
jgi:hypothetical protein